MKQHSQSLRLNVERALSRHITLSEYGGIMGL
jgi:hypothetical protein